jgi:hypothetical protein
MGNTHWRDPNGASESRLGHTSLLQNFAKEHARMNRGKAALDHVCLKSVVIDDRDVEGVTGREAKSHPPLVVDADAPLTFAVGPQRFEAIRRWQPQISQLGRSVELRESHRSPIANLRWQST